MGLGAANAQKSPQPVRFDFKAVNVAQVVQLIYGEALTTPYVIDPEVLNDSRAVSFRYSSDKGDIRGFVRTFLKTLGYEVSSENGIDLISKRPASVEKEPVVELESYVYKPRYRDVNYLSRVLGPLFKGSFSVNRSVAGSGVKPDKAAPDGSAAAMVDQNGDVLVFTGVAKEVEQLKKLLPQVDFQLGEVVVRGVVYEVNMSDKDGSAFGLVASLLGGHLSAGVGAVDAVGAFLRFKNTSLDAVYSVISQDSRFKVMSSPSLRIRSGSEGSFSVGQEVPVLGAVSYASNGMAVQSVTYRSSGVLFNIAPTVREGVIDLGIDQQLSNFAQTTTGVNGSPTLTKRALKTSVGMQDGDLIVLGGLTENKESGTRDGPSFLPRFLHSSGREQSRLEILLVLQVQRI
jgi:type II secretory pathway component GspD/PulD (secretin)